MMLVARRLLPLLAAARAGVGRRIEVYPPSSCPATTSSDHDPHQTAAFCSLAGAADWVSRRNANQQQEANRQPLGEQEATAEVCLHPGLHTVRQPIRLNGSHSGSRWTTCTSAVPGARATISGGLSIPAATWQREAAGLWSAILPAAARVRHLRTLWVGGARANRTVLNASMLLGGLRVTAAGYVSQREVPWQPDAEDVELNYFQQLAPWQAQRCVLMHAAGHRLTVAQPCFASVNRRAASVPGLPRNKSSGRSGCADSNPECGLLGNPLGSGLPMFIEHIPLTDPGLPLHSRAAGQFSFSPRQQKLWYRPHPHELSRDGSAFLADAVAPISEGLITAVGLRHVSFTGIDFAYMAWNSPSLPGGFVDLQDGITELGYIPGALDCMNCSDCAVVECGFSKLGGSGVTVNGIAQRIQLVGVEVHDVSGNGIVIGASHGNDRCALL